MAQDRASELGEEAFDEVELGAVLRCECELEAAIRLGSEPGFGFLGDVRGMIVEDQLYRGAGRISGIEKLEELNKFPAAVAVSDQGMHLPGEQVDPRQQAERAVALVLMISREGRVNTGLGRQIRRRRCDRLDSRLFVVGDDCHRLTGWLRFGAGLFENLDFAIDAQNLCHLLLKLGVATFQIVAHLVRLDFLLAENLAHRALDQLGKAVVSRPRSALARMTCQQPRRPQLMRITMVLGLVARDGYQPSLGLRRNLRLLAGSRPIIERRQRPIGQRPFEASLDGLVMDAKLSPHSKKRWILMVGEQHLRPCHSARRLGSRARKARQARNFLLAHRQLDHLPPSRHDAIPRSATRKRGIQKLTTGSMTAGFMESVVSLM